MHGNVPGLLARVMSLTRVQNVVITEVELIIGERKWYTRKLLLAKARIPAILKEKYAFSGEEPV